MISDQLQELGFSQYEITCYLALVANHPANGSQLSKASGLARSRIYDVLRNLVRRGFVDEVGQGNYTPLPPEELIKRLKITFEANLAALKAEIGRTTLRSDHDHVWTIRGYNQVMAKAVDMLDSAENEAFVRLFPEEGHRLDDALQRAAERGVVIKYVALGQPASRFRHQVSHRDSARVRQALDGRAIDVVVDRTEALSGIFTEAEENISPINWSRNRTMVFTNRERIRHEFFSAYLHKTLDLGQPLTDEERLTYEMIKEDY